MNQRFIDEWVPIKVDKESNHDEIKIIEKFNLKETSSKIKMLIEKLYAIGNSLKGKVEESKAVMKASKQRLRHFPSLTASHAKISIDFNLLPQVKELKFLIQSDCTKPLRIYLDIFNKIPFLMEDKTWPGRCYEIPMNVFKENVYHLEELSISDVNCM
nr:uncharacterized protein LOC111421868 [Onthophagus taurus]